MSISHPILPAEEYRLRAVKAMETREASWQRSDSDGFLTQWAMDNAAHEYEALAQLAERGGRAQFRALFDLEGRLIAAKNVQARYGPCWAILAGDDPESAILAWFRQSVAQKPEVRRRNDARKGYFLGWVEAAAAVKAFGSISVVYAPVRVDGGFSRDVLVLDNGVGDCPHVLVLDGVCAGCGQATVAGVVGGALF